MNKHADHRTIYVLMVLIDKLILFLNVFSRMYQIFSVFFAVLEPKMRHSLTQCKRMRFVCENINFLFKWSHTHRQWMHCILYYGVCIVYIAHAWCTLKTIKMTRFKNKLRSVIVHHQNTLWTLRIHALFNYYSCVFNLLLLNGRSHIQHFALRRMRHFAYEAFRICKYLSNKCMNSSDPMSDEASILPTPLTWTWTF